MIGKVLWGETASFAYDGGGTAEVSDWNLCPADLQSLLRISGQTLGVRYGSQTIELATFEPDPSATPPPLLAPGSRTTPAP